MDRRNFTRLLCTLPLVLALKPESRPANHKLCCAVCGKEMGEVLWPQRVVKEGTTLCEVHANRPDGKGIITDYHFDFYQDADAQAEVDRQMAEYDQDRELQRIAQEVVDELRKTDPEVVEMLERARLA